MGLQAEKPQRLLPGRFLRENKSNFTFSSPPERQAVPRVRAPYAAAHGQGTHRADQQVIGGRLDSGRLCAPGRGRHQGASTTDTSRELAGVFALGMKISPIAMICAAGSCGPTEVNLTLLSVSRPIRSSLFDGANDGTLGPTEQRQDTTTSASRPELRAVGRPDEEFAFVVHGTMADAAGWTRSIRTNAPRGLADWVILKW